VGSYVNNITVQIEKHMASPASLSINNIMESQLDCQYPKNVL
jgi:hypothetical protein